MRLFIAVNFEEDVKEQLIAVQERLRLHIERGRLSRRENLHLTLAFLGETDADRLPAVRQVMEEMEWEPLRLSIARTGRFRGRNGDTWWAGVEAHEPLLRIQRRLSQQLARAGFSVEQRPYQPHLTLAREVVLRELPLSGELLPEPIMAAADRCSLMLSERPAGKLTYTELFARE